MPLFKLPNHQSQSNVESLLEKTETTNIRNPKNRRAFAVEETPRNKYSCLRENYFYNHKELYNVVIGFKKVSDRAISGSSEQSSLTNIRGTKFV